MKTLKRESINTSGKVEKEYLRVKENEVNSNLSNGWKYCGKIEWKTATKGYGKTKSVVTVVDKPKTMADVLDKPKKSYSKPKRS